MAASEDPVDLQALVHQWGREFALERELAALSTEPDATWVALAEAERQANVSRSTLRTWYRTGQVASRLTPGPHGLQRLVPLEVILERAARSPRTGPKPAPEEAPMSTPDALVRMAELATQSATARAESAEARALDAETALREALERAATAETELRLLRPHG